jgi:DNA polymerase-1
MLINADAKALEWVCAAALSRDPVAVKEILNNEDQHTDNQERFRLPTRLIAKTFLFRIIYGGSANGFANDPDFSSIGSKKFWQRVIDAFYEKYPGIHRWHDDLWREALEAGSIRIPTGRRYSYPQSELITNPYGWRPRVLNYCVQGLGAELMAIVRRNLWFLLQAYENKDDNPIKLISTVHDSILLDTVPEECYNICTLMKKAFESTPKTFSRLFDYDLGVPMRVEISVGPNWKDMKEIA